VLAKTDDETRLPAADEMTDLVPDRQQYGTNRPDEVAAELRDTPQGKQNDEPEEERHHGAQDECIGIVGNAGSRGAQRRVLQVLRQQEVPGHKKEIADRDQEVLQRCEPGVNHVDNPELWCSVSRRTVNEITVLHPP
jgi:hypothetical protein